MNKRLLVFLLIGLLMIGGVFTATAQDTPGTIADIVVASSTAETPEFTTLLAAVQAADPAVLEALSSSESELTVFAPTDAAFAALGEETINAVLADQALLTNILLFHVAPGTYLSSDVVAGLGLDMMEEATPEAGMEMMEPMAAPVLSVPTLQGQYIDITTDDMGDILVNGAPLNLSMVDIQASNGVIHVIDAVILPESRTIADIVVASAGAEAPEFATLLAAVQAADPAVLETLSNPEAELTVFAPTDAAFAALGEETINAVLADQAMLTNILLYHVVPGVVHSTDVVTMVSESTDMSLAVDTALEGAQINISAGEGMPVMINNAQLVITDIDASNGVIHVIDAVLLPPTE